MNGPFVEVTTVLGVRSVGNGSSYELIQFLSLSVGKTTIEVIRGPESALIERSDGNRG